MAKKPGTRSAGRAASPTVITSPRKPTGRQPKTDAERFDDLLKKSDFKELAERPRGIGKGKTKKN